MKDVQYIRYILDFFQLVTDNLSEAGVGTPDLRQEIGVGDDAINW